MQAVADKLSVTYEADGDSADTTTTLTEKIAAVTPTKTKLKAMNAEQLKVYADVLEMTYTYTSKETLIALILAETATE